MPFIDVKGRKVHYADTGPAGDSVASAPTTLLMIHGLGSSQDFFFPTLPWLRNFRSIIPDTPGAGRSPFPGGEMTIAGIADHSHSLLDNLGVNKVIIVGHSMGGTAALDFAARFPERTSAVVAIGPVNPNPGIAPVFEKRIEVVSKGISAVYDHWSPVVLITTSFRGHGTHGRLDPQSSNRI
jgi:pimeloyl-ACP methyl ester carboxylesterase